MIKQSRTKTRVADAPVRKGWSLHPRPFTGGAIVGPQPIGSSSTHDSGFTSSVRAFRNELTESAAAAPLQSKLRLGAAGDEYERQADRVAKRVQADVAGSGHGVRQPVPRVRPVVGTRGTANVPKEVEAGIERSHGRGEQFAPSARAPLERAFGVDFRGVRLHTDALADRLSHSIQAEAFTCGNDIFFAGGRCDWGTGPRRALLVHELTHVAQQGAAGQTDTMRPSSPPRDRAQTPGLIQRAFRSLVGRGNSNNDNAQEEDDFRTPSGYLVGSVGVSYPSFEFGGYFLEDHLGSDLDDALEKSVRRPGPRGLKNTVVLSTAEALEERIQNAGKNKLETYREMNERRFLLTIRCEFVNVECRGTGERREWSSYGTYDSNVTFKGRIEKKTLQLTGIESANTRNVITFRRR